jgi:hypothetical protein
MGTIHGFLRHQPRERDLARSGLLAFRPCLASSTSARLCGTFSGEKRGFAAANVPGAKRVCPSMAPVMNPDAERTPRHEADPELLAEPG